MTTTRWINSAKKKPKAPDRSQNLFGDIKEADYVRIKRETEKWFIGVEKDATCPKCVMGEETSFHSKTLVWTDILIFKKELGKFGLRREEVRNCNKGGGINHTNDGLILVTDRFLNVVRQLGELLKDDNLINLQIRKIETSFLTSFLEDKVAILVVQLTQHEF